MLKSFKTDIKLEPQRKLRKLKKCINHVTVKVKLKPVQEVEPVKHNSTAKKVQKTIDELFIDTQTELRGSMQGW